MSTQKVYMTAKQGLIFTPERIRPALEYIDTYWQRLERFAPHDQGTLVGLPKPYFVPSPRNNTGFAYEEMFYWDTFFIAYGLLGTPREHQIRGLVEDLMAMMNRFEIIPNGGRTFLTGRSQPPFLTSFIMMVYQIEGDKAWLESSMNVAKEEYRRVWMGVEHPHWRNVFHGLSRYYDTNVLDDLAECESGWDMTTRFNRQCLSYLPPDLNALLYKYEEDFATTARILGYPEEAGEWAKRAMQRKRLMRRYLWDEEQGFYFDYNYVTGRHSNVWSLAGFYSMWAGMENKIGAARIMQHLDKFECDGGLSTTSGRPRVSSRVPVQWAYPNGWAPLQLLAIGGMERYGYHEEAERVARKWIMANLVHFEKEGVFFEKYNVVDIHAEPAAGVYPSQTGFGWSNAAFTYLTRAYLKPEELGVSRPIGTVA